MEELVNAEPQKDNVQELEVEEFHKLLKDYNENVQSYRELTEECSKVKAERDSLIQTIKSMEELVQAEPQKDNVQEQKAEEYVKLLEDYNQNVETYKELNEECSKVIAERDSLIQTIKLMEELALQSPSIAQETEEEKQSIQEENTAAHNELL